MAMRNVKVSRKAGKITIILDETAAPELSKSQLSHVFATTGGLAVIEGGYRLNLNLTKDRDDLSIDDRVSLRAAAKAAKAGR